MSQKVTLSIPDRLHEKLIRWRSSFNFSKLFQDALVDAIEKKETLQKRFVFEMDMPQIVQRLKKEKSSCGAKNVLILVKQQPQAGVKTARYETLVYVTAFERYYDIIFDPEMSCYFKQLYQSAGLAPYPFTTDLLHQDRQLIDGWYNGLFEFWNQVKDKI